VINSRNYETKSMGLQSISVRLCSAILQTRVFKDDFFGGKQYFLYFEHISYAHSNCLPIIPLQSLFILFFCFVSHRFNALFYFIFFAMNSMASKA